MESRFRNLEIITEERIQRELARRMSHGAV